MAIQFFEQALDRSLEVSKDKTYVRRWIAETDDPDIEQGTVYAAAPVQRGYVYSKGSFTDLNATCKTVTVNAHIDDQHWIIEATYDTQPDDTNPLEEPPQESWSTDNYEVPFDVTWDNKPVLNSAKQPFSEQQVKDEARHVLTVTANVAAPNYALYRALTNKVNAASWRGAPPKTLRCMGAPQVEQKNDSEIGKYYTVSMRFEYQPTGWSLKVVDKGLHELDSNGKPVRLLDNGQPVEEDVLLDGNGKRLDPEAQHVELEFERYEPVNFTQFGF